MGAGIVTLREGFEASLVVVLVLSYVARTGRREDLRPVWAGVAAAVAVSVAAAASLFAIGAELGDGAEAAFEGTTMIAAAALLTWMIFWMRGRAGAIRAHVEEQVEEPSVPRLRLHAVGQLHSVPERRERPVHDANDLSYQHLRRRPAEPVASLPAALARHDARVLERHEDPFEELLGDLLLLGDLVDLHEAALVGLGEVRERLERVQPATGYLHVY